jgi:hypothetical protein
LSDDLRARVSGPSEGRVSKARETIKPLVLDACACLVRPLTSFPSLGHPEDIRCHRCARRQERSSCQRDGPV